MSYIEREALRDALYEADAITIKGVAIINQFPAADVVPVVHGEWVEARLNGMSLYPVGQKMCSVCGQIMPSRWETMPPFCYGCGALMYGGEKHE